jgi:hypothetical protein
VEFFVLLFVLFLGFGPMVFAGVMVKKKIAARMEDRKR